MFLDKLWLRLRGELLALKEDLEDDKDLRANAERLLEKLETRLRTSGAQRVQRQEHATDSEDESSESTGSESWRSIEREWQDLQRQRRQQQKPEASVPPEPNPRKLG